MRVLRQWASVELRRGDWNAVTTIWSRLLARDPGNLEAINTIFRGFHTIKGLAGFLEFLPIQRFAHEVETLLDLARNLKAPVDSVQ